MTAAYTPSLTEADWMGWVVDLAHWHGWKVAHFRPARTQHGWRTAGQYDAKGWPDLVLVNPERGGVLFREVKSDTGRLDDDQALWRNWLVSAGADWGIWQPRDRDTVVAEITDGKWTVP